MTDLLANGGVEFKLSTTLEVGIGEDIDLNAPAVGQLPDLDDEPEDPEQREEIRAIKEAKSRAEVLEMIGDIPHADIKPPENVLFVCKLNPATQEEDLEVIFSRYGRILSCEIIRDHKTGDSLCYAFIEFEDKESCENAYFKMDNVLIDDRRIHVDFSQSVAKLHKKYWYTKLQQQANDPQHHRKKSSNGALPMLTMQERRGDNKQYQMVFDSPAPTPNRNQPFSTPLRQKTRYYHQSRSESQSQSQHQQRDHLEHHSQAKNTTPATRTKPTRWDVPAPLPVQITNNINHNPPASHDLSTENPKKKKRQGQK